MGEIIYWKKFDEPIKTIDDFTGKEIEVNGEWQCNHPLVDRAWCTVSFHPCAVNNDALRYMCNVILKTYERHSFYSDSIPINEPFDLESLISKAEQYLKSLQ